MFMHISLSINFFQILSLFHPFLAVLIKDVMAEYINKGPKFCIGATRWLAAPYTDFFLRITMFGHVSKLLFHTLFKIFCVESQHGSSCKKHTYKKPKLIENDRSDAYFILFMI